MYKKPTYPILRMFPPNKDELLLYLDFNVVDDYFRDESGLGLHCLAITTTTPYDLI